VSVHPDFFDECEFIATMITVNISRPEKQVTLIKVLLASLFFSASVASGSGALTNAENFNLPVTPGPFQPNWKSNAPDKAVEVLLAKMTVEEKVYQLCAAYFEKGDEILEAGGAVTEQKIAAQLGTHGVGSISCPAIALDPAKSVEEINSLQRYAVEKTRLGIPLLVNHEGLHGLVMKGACSYPQAIGLAATFNPDLVEQIGAAIGVEARSRGCNQLLDPVLDLGREPRHGRVEETYGEDPFLASRMGVAFIQGTQSKGVICTPKHFAANFCGDGGREGANVSLSERELRETYFLPFEAAVREGGALGIMCAYNALDGVPCAMNHWLLTDVLRGEWNFQGIVVSDWSAVNHVHGTQHAAATKGDAARLCLLAGLDVDLPRENYYLELINEVKAGRVSEADLNKSVRRVLQLKYRLGLFQNPYVKSADALREADSDEHRKLALEAARQSVVLLKNDRSVLPLNPNVKRIAVIGPNANVLALGGYSAPDVNGVTVLAGLKNRLGAGVSIAYERGCGINDVQANEKDLAKAVAAAKNADLCILVMGGANGVTGGETRERATLELMGQQENLIAAIAATGKPVVIVLLDGRPIVMNRWIDKVDAVLMAWYPGEEGGNAIADILTGACNPSGHLPITSPKLTGQCPMTYDYHPYGREGGYVELPSGKMSDRYAAQFPFGFGLSYTTFAYSQPQCVPERISTNGTVNISVSVTNTGPVAGETVVQLYLSREFCRITQPVERLRGFRRIALEPSQTKTVTFVLDLQDFQFLDEHLKPCVAPGVFHVRLGGDCLNGVTGTFSVIQ